MDNRMRMVTAWGETKKLGDWVQDPRCVISQPSLTERLDSGMSPEEAISTPPVRKGRTGMNPVKVGDIFGRLVVIEGPWMEKKGKQMASKVKVQCSCGGPNMYKEVFVNSLRGNGNSKTVSCGCLKAEKASERTTIRNTTHGMSQHGLYSQYNAMMNRCYRPEVNQYKDYGGRGITVCEEWKQDFLHFAQWALKNGWVQGLTIERVNNNEGYSPTNCKWATSVEQGNNKRNNRRLEAFGKTQTLAQWSRDAEFNALQIPYYVLYDRVTKLGWSMEAALLAPVRPLEPTT